MTASKFNRRPSELMEMDDPGVALAFDVECAETLRLWETEQQAKMFELIGIASVAGSLGGVVPQRGDASKTERW